MCLAATPNPSGSSISPDSRRRILAALNGFRPKFRQIAQTLTDVDLVFVEEAMERWMLEYDRAFACTSVPLSLGLCPSACPSAEGRQMETVANTCTYL